jgi:hypothetical protein
MMDDDDDGDYYYYYYYEECEAVGGMNGGGTLRTRGKPGKVQLCPPQISHDLTWARTRAAAVECRRLTA